MMKDLESKDLATIWKERTGGKVESQSKNGNSVKTDFSTEAEAKSANLPDGTPITIGGKKGKWYN